MIIENLDDFIKEATSDENPGKGKISLFPSVTAIGRNVVWCPYLNEPAFLRIIEKDGRTLLDCENCNHNYEPTSHPFICRILKP